MILKNLFINSILYYYKNLSKNYFNINKIVKFIIKKY